MFFLRTADRGIDRRLVVSGKIDAHRGHLRCGFDHFDLRLAEVLLSNESGYQRTANLSIDMHWRNIFEGVRFVGKKKLFCTLMAVADLGRKKLDQFIEACPIQEVGIEFAASIKSTTN